MDTLCRADLAASRKAFILACHYSRAWDTVYETALRVYGDHGAHVSGSGREHFPAQTKRQLLALAHAVSDNCAAAYKARPPRVRRSTIERLWQAVAQRYGCGYYGPVSHRS